MFRKSCPTEEELQAFNQGYVDEDALQQISQHIDDCEHCLTRLELMPAGTLAENLRKSLTLSAADVDSAESSSEIDWSKFEPSRYRQLGFDCYELLGLLGNSRLGTCYLAAKEECESEMESFALKIPFVEKLTSPDHVKLFLKDADAARSLEHPNILKVADSGFWQEGVPFIATPYLNEPSLKRVAKTSRLADEQLLRCLFLQICIAIQHAHEQGIIHRHLTPNNIFLKPGRTIVVTDFCIHYDGYYQFDLTEPILDPDPFVSPESANNNPEFIDHRTDIYALGKILKLLLRLTDEIDDAKLFHWQKIQAKCTRPRRRDRFQSVQQLVAVAEASAAPGQA